MLDNKLEDRIAELERRVSAIEAGLANSASRGKLEGSESGPVGQQVDLIVLDKRYQPSDPMNGIYQDHIWFDCEFRAAQVKSPVRAIKGTIEFCDLFGEPRFRIGYTLNECLQPGGRVMVPGLGFEYNQFMNEHQWMLATDLDDMTIRFQVAQILYEDGTNETVR